MRDSLSTDKIKKLCVILAVYKNDNLSHLKESLESLFNQTYTDFDIYIQQDGEIPNDLESYLDNLDKEGKIKYLGKRSENQGLAYSLNELLHLVCDKYYYIARMDADDISLPKRFETQVSFMDTHPHVDISGSYIEEFNLADNYKRIVTYPTTHSHCKNYFYKRNPLAHPSVIFRKSFFEKVSLYPTHTKCHEDTALWTNAFIAGCYFSNIDEVLLQFRLSEDFYLRRSKHKLSKLIDRLFVVYKLKYPPYCYIYPIIRFFIQSLPVFLLKFFYKIR